MHVLRGVRAEDFLGRIPQRRAHGVAAEGELAGAVVLPDPVLRGGDDVAKLFFQGHATAADRRIADGPAHGRHQARQVGLEDVVVGTALQGIDGAFFAQRPRQEDERSVGRELVRNLERRDAVEAGQREIREDDVGPEFTQHAAQSRFGVHPLPRAGETTGFELTDRDFRFHRHVFDENQSDRLHSNSSRSS